MDYGETVAVGTWLYDGHVPTGVKIVRQPFRRGSGDHEDPIHIRDGSADPCFVPWWQSPGEAGYHAASGQHETAEAAKAAADALVPGIKWESE